MLLRKGYRQKKILFQQKATKKPQRQKPQRHSKTDKGGKTAFPYHLRQPDARNCTGHSFAPPALAGFAIIGQLKINTPPFWDTHRTLSQPAYCSLHRTASVCDRNCPETTPHYAAPKGRGTAQHRTRTATALCCKDIITERTDLSSPNP